MGLSGLTFGPTLENDILDSEGKEETLCGRKMWPPTQRDQTFGN